MKTGMITLLLVGFASLSMQSFADTPDDGTVDPDTLIEAQKDCCEAFKDPSLGQLKSREAAVREAQALTGDSKEPAAGKTKTSK